MVPSQDFPHQAPFSLGQHALTIPSASEEEGEIEGESIGENEESAEKEKVATRIKEKQE